MKKSVQASINANLDKALDSAKPKPKQNLDAILGEYEDEASEPTQLDSTQLTPTRLNSTQLASPVAPVRDYNKRANSIERDAMPAGLFPGTSKKLYDALYLRTRGAIVPTRSVKATRTELMRWAGIGGLNTFLSHVKHLTGVGLIIRTFEIGDKEGAIYEVRVPEEVDSTRLNSTRLNSTRIDSTPNRVHDSTHNMSRVESSELVDFKEQTDILQTSFKTKINTDDEPTAFDGLTKVFTSVALDLTGKLPGAADELRWRELAEVLAAELRIAAARTTISNVPAFLAEHLRRRLWKLDKKQAQAEGRELPDQVVTAAAREAAPAECPDCKGSGWWYPDGPDKGVAKCKHGRIDPKP